MGLVPDDLNEANDPGSYQESQLLSLEESVGGRGKKKAPGRPPSLFNQRSAGRGRGKKPLHDTYS